MELKTLKTQAILGYQLGRFATFASQSLSLPLIEGLATGRFRYFEPEFLPRSQQAFESALALLRRDAEHIANGVYPIDVLQPESPLKFLKRFPQILRDGFDVAKRRATDEADDFADEAREELPDFPKYFRRQFHFQTGGYLTDESAELYEHQVEILFSGAADAMRRLLLPDLKKALDGKKAPRLLEVAAGTGRLTRFVKQAFPDAQITVTDLSPAYLKKARDNLRDFSRLDFLHADASDLPFRDAQYDAVYSCFLFHEIPLNVRRLVLQESARVLKPDGVLGIVDSIQQGDSPTLEWGLETFPKDFHEPFYKNYVAHPLETLVADAGFTLPAVTTGFFSKSLVAAKA